MERNPSIEEEDKNAMHDNPSTEPEARPARRIPSIGLVETLRIPAGAHALEGFRRWTWSESFPEKGRIDFLDGELEIDLSPENVYQHGVAKMAIAAALHDQVTRTGKGLVCVDATRVVSVDASISVEPDVVAVLWDSVETGRVRLEPAADGEPGSFVELEGAVDLVVEVVSKSSVGKDRRRLPPLYAKAGVPELWLIDARRLHHAVELRIHHLGATGYLLAPPDAEGSSYSRLLARRCRLRRHAVRDIGFTYDLEVG
jgi:Uma2 family endonuclease